MHVCVHRAFLFSCGSVPADLFLKISPGCQPRSPDICEKPRRRFGVEARSGDWCAASEAISKKGRQEVVFFFLLCLSWGFAA